MEHFILVGNSMRIALPVLQAIRSFSDASCTVLGDEKTLALRWSRLCKRHVCVDFGGGGDDDFVRWVHQFAEKTPQAVLIPFDCDGIRLVNRVLARLQLGIVPIPDLLTLDLFDDKWRFHEFCTKNSLSVPTTRWVASKFDLDFSAIASELGLPFVLKPTNQSGSLGVQVVGSRHQYEAEILSSAAYNFGPLIAQRYIDGEDIDLSLLSIRGRLVAFAIQQASGCQVDFVSNVYLEDIAEKICRDSAYHGVMHIDARIENRTGKVFLIESNPRFWASVTASVWCGLNFVAESIQQPSQAGSPPGLISGRSYNRHPLLRPAAWPGLADAGERGRLLRAWMFDGYTLVKLLQALPRMAARSVKRQTRWISKLLQLGTPRAA